MQVEAADTLLTLNVYVEKGRTLHCVESDPVLKLLGGLRFAIPGFVVFCNIVPR